MQEQQAVAALASLKDFYWIVGIMVVMNISTIIAVLVAVGRTIWWASDITGKVKRNTKDINNAHEIIKEINRGNA